MKIRSGFVSNSSSSSFLIIREIPEGPGSFLVGDYSDSKPYSGVYKVGKQGKICFGWGPGKLNGMHSKINFAYLQALASTNEGWVKMIDEVIRDRHPGITIDLSILKEKMEELDAYIDHQSSAVEGANTEIFDNKDTLMNFLFSSESCIILDNDNTDYEYLVEE